jgi:hypothetical protein
MLFGVADAWIYVKPVPKTRSLAAADPRGIPENVKDCLAANGIKFLSLRVAVETVCARVAPDEKTPLLFVKPLLLNAT